MARFAQCEMLPQIAIARLPNRRSFLAVAGVPWEFDLLEAKLAVVAQTKKGIRKVHCHGAYCAMPLPNDQFSIFTSTKLMNGFLAPCAGHRQRPDRSFSLARLCGPR